MTIASVDESSGSDKLPLDFVTLVTWNFVPTQGALHRGYDFTLMTIDSIKYTQTCSSGPIPTVGPVLPLGTATYLDKNRVADDGISTKDHPSVDAELAMYGKFNWKLVVDPP